MTETFHSTQPTHGQPQPDVLWDIHDESDDEFERERLRNEIDRYSRPSRTDGHKHMTRTWKIVLAVMIALFAVLAASRSASAAPDYGSITMSWLQVSHHKHTVSLATGKKAERLLSLWEARGVAMINEPNVATVEMMATANVTAQRGQYTAYLTYTFADGAVLYLRMDANVTEADGMIGNTQQGKLTLIGGTQRYKGASGTGRFTAIQYGAAAEEATTVFRMTATFKQKSTAISERFVQR